MVASIVNAVAAADVSRGDGDATPWEVLYTFPHTREPLDEQTSKRLEACRRAPSVLPAGHA